MPSMPSVPGAGAGMLDLTRLQGAIGGGGGRRAYRALTAAA
jgi:hypothetical protein